MGAIRMHADEVDTSSELVRSLLRDQFPQWAGLPITPVDSYGTDHDIYRVGEDLSVRLPRIEGATRQARIEGEWLARLAPHLPTRVPTQIARGTPGHGFPYDWSVCDWLPGAAADPRSDDLVDGLAGFVLALRSIDTAGAPPRRPGSRGGPLSERDQDVRRAIDDLGDRVDSDAVSRAWDAALAAPAWDTDVWVHADLLPGNLIVDQSRLVGVIDWGTMSVGDPACDLLPAWNVFSTRGREAFRAALDVDDATWERGRGWALQQAVVALPYYWNTNPGMVRQARIAIARLLRSRT